MELSNYIASWPVVGDHDDFAASRPSFADPQVTTAAPHKLRKVTYKRSKRH